MRTPTTGLLLSTLLVVAAVAGALPGAVAAAGVGTGVESPAANPTTPNVAVQAGTCEFPVSATDATGTEVAVEERPERVTTLSPSAAQTMWEVGGESQVVGVTRFASYLDGAESKANVSGSGQAAISVEKVVGTEPDLVLAPNVVPNQTVTQLRDAGLTVVKFEAATSVEDVREKTTLVGELTGNCEGAAQANAWMMQNVAAAENATAGVEPVRAINALGGGFVAGDETFVDAMLAVSGATNVAAEANVTGFAQLSDETVASLDPEYVVVTYPGAVDLSAQPWADTPAGQNNATVTVDSTYLGQPAPRSVVFGVRNLTEAFHPDAYGEAQFVSRSEVEANASTGNATDENASAGDESTDANATSTTVASDSTASEDGDGGAEVTTGTATPTETGDETSSTSPGFGAGVAALALLASALLAVRRD
ncbi:PGF-CTERM-anchored ABC transporter substrate-binding protein [Halobium salinum]|uniref:PGF-CTERM-anchored ABC transporter substrate-binding protein n=1 Tax=Halobium salinum TaxID=1364940 RepID=A0ABD5PD87_9EURY|nr:PGF-CTERM-anchored ABC transporter substrate-binding protein [Halobium salinum]